MQLALGTAPGRWSLVGGDVDEGGVWLRFATEAGRRETFVPVTVREDGEIETVEALLVFHDPSEVS